MSIEFEILETLKNQLETELDKIEDIADEFGYTAVGFGPSLAKSDDEYFYAKQWMNVWEQKCDLENKMYKIAFPNTTEL